MVTLTPTTKKRLAIAGWISAAVDIFTDWYSVRGYAINGDKYWCGLTTIFVILPLFWSVPACCILICRQAEWSVRKKVLMCALCVVLAPITPLVVLGATIYGTYSDGQVIVVPRVRWWQRGIFKLLEVLLEAGPQALLQIYIVLQSTQDDAVTIAWWQWASIGSSIVALSFTVATSSFWEEAATSSKVCYFIAGGLGFASRGTVCAMWSIPHPGYLLVPFVTEILVHWVTGAIVVYCGCCRPQLRDVESADTTTANCVEETADIRANRAAYCGKVCGYAGLNSYYAMLDSWTDVGLMVSLVNACFAYAGFALEGVPQTVAVVVVALSALSITVNGIVTAFYWQVEKDWQLGIEKFTPEQRDNI